MLSDFKGLILIMEATILIILVIFPGVWGGSWGVVSKDQCAVRGSSVVIPCQYHYPNPFLVTSVMWYKSRLVSGQTELVPLSEIPSAPDHFRYVGDRGSDCRLQINNVQESDRGLYYFRFWTTFFRRWTSEKPARLTVTDLSAVVDPSTVTEGDRVRLTCVSDCPTPLDVVWFRDGQPVSKQVLKARREDAGMYYCAVPGQETVRSASVALNVQYAPREVLLSLTPSPSSEVIVKGSLVTFTCSSDANPPVRKSEYTFYKDGNRISRGQNYTISDVQSSHSGLYHCQAWNNISRTGIDLFNSTEVHLDVQYPPVNVKVSMTPPVVTEGSSVNLTCSSSANPAAEKYTWFWRSLSSSSLLQVGSGQMLSLSSVNESHMGLYLCQAGNTHGENNSTEVLLTMGADSDGSQSVFILAGVGVFLVILLLALLFFWRKKKTHMNKRQNLLAVSRESSDFSVNEDESVSVYANVSAFPSSPASDQNTSPHTKTGSHSKHNTQKYQEDDVTYSTVTIKSRNPPHFNDDRARKDSRLRREGNDDSVIYSTLSKPS